MKRAILLFICAVQYVLPAAVHGSALPDQLPLESCGVNHCIFSGERPNPAAGMKVIGSLDAAAYGRSGPVSVSYTAFNTSNYVMQAFMGKYTSVLVKPADLAYFTEAQAWELVDLADYLYESYKELMAVEPLGSGPLTIAFVDTCGGGCGYVGWRGVELGPYFANGGAWFAKGTLQDLYGYLAHEMGHNFDRWSSYIMYGSDVAHAWSAFIDAYIVTANRRGQDANSGGGRGCAPDDVLSNRITDFFEPYLKHAGANWQTCVRNALCTNTNPGAVQGGFVARLAKLVGPTATRQAMVMLKSAATTRGLNPSTMTPDQKNDLLLECFSLGAQTNLCCVAAPLCWSASTALESEMEELYGPTHAACIDGDGDGYTPLQGDLNDALASVKPGGTEVLNQVDDDCNGVVDDLTYSESSDFPNSRGAAQALSCPFIVSGAISSSSDSDYFQISLSAPAKVRFRLKSSDVFAGWLFIYTATGSWMTYAYCGAGSKADLEVTFPAGQWQFSVSQNVSSAPGSYQLTGSPVSEWPIYVYPLPPQKVEPNLWRLYSCGATTNMIGVSNIQARFWISNVGWVATNAVDGTNVCSILWAPTGIVASAETTYRVQLYQSLNPLARISEAMPLSGVIPLKPTAPSNGVVRLEWSAASPGLSLSQATSLSGQWASLTNASFFTNGVFQVTIKPATNGTHFFRFKR